MTKKNLSALAALALLALGGGAASAAAVRPGGQLYVKAKNTQLRASTKATAETLAVLQPGQAVVYKAKEAGVPWVRVSATVPSGGAKKPVEGVVYQGSLSTTPPPTEVSAKAPGKKLDPQAFASSGAAVKALGAGALEYGRTLERKDSAQQLQALEKQAAAVSEAEAAAYARAAGLPSAGAPPSAATASTGGGQ